MSFGGAGDSRKPPLSCYFLLCLWFRVWKSTLNFQSNLTCVLSCCCLAVVVVLLLLSNLSSQSKGKWWSFAELTGHGITLMASRDLEDNPARTRQQLKLWCCPYCLLFPSAMWENLFFFSTPRDCLNLSFAAALAVPEYTQVWVVHAHFLHR